MYPFHLWIRRVQCFTTTLHVSIVLSLVLIMLFLSFNSRVQMPAEWPLANRELPGYPIVNATLQHTGVPEQCPPSSWAFKQLSISYESTESTEVSMLSAMGHLSLSNLMKRETSTMTKLLLQDPKRPNQ